MKASNITKYFPDQDVRTVITGGSTKKVGGKSLARNILRSDNREKVVERFLQCLAANKDEKCCKETLYKFAVIWQRPEYKTAFSDRITTSCQKILEPFKKKIDKKIAKDAPIIYDAFPEEVCLLSNFKDKFKDRKSAGELLRLIKTNSNELDTSITTLPRTISKHPEYRKRGYHTSPFDHNRLGREVEGTYLNASEVHLKDGPKYIFAAIPRDSVTIADYYHCLMQKGTKVVVTTNPTLESEDCRPFWLNTELEKVTFRDGWTIREIATNVLMKNKSSKGPELIQRTLNVTKGGEAKTITHLHYENWPDHKAAPDDEMLSALVHKINELQTTNDHPIAINCKGGIGRTGTLAIAHLAIHEIKKQLKAGKKKDEVSLNIAKMIYSLRKERRGMVSHKEQILQIYRLIHEYYKTLD